MGGFFVSGGHIQIHQKALPSESADTADTCNADSVDFVAERCIPPTISSWAKKFGAQIFTNEAALEAASIAAGFAHVTSQPFPTPSLIFLAGSTTAQFVLVDASDHKGLHFSTTTMSMRSAADLSDGNTKGVREAYSTLVLSKLQNLTGSDDLTRPINAIFFCTELATELGQLSANISDDSFLKKYAGQDAPQLIASKSFDVQRPDRSTRMHVKDVVDAVQAAVSEARGPHDKEAPLLSGRKSRILLQFLGDLLQRYVKPQTDFFMFKQLRDTRDGVARMITTEALHGVASEMLQQKSQRPSVSAGEL